MIERETGKRLLNACEAMAPRLKCTSRVAPASGSVLLLTVVAAFSVNAPGVPYIGITR